MTVGELVKELQRFDQNLNVYFSNGESDYSLFEIDEYAIGVYVDLKEE